MEGLDKFLFLCYNISMINEIESFYFILSFVVKGNTRCIKPEERARTYLKKTVCGSTAHRKNPIASPPTK